MLKPCSSSAAILRSTSEWADTTETCMSRCAKVALQAHTETSVCTIRLGLACHIVRSLHCKYILRLRFGLVITQCCNSPASFPKLFRIPVLCKVVWLQDEAGLLMQLDAIQGSGTIIIISNLRRNSADQLELDFDADASDIRIAADPPEEGSASPAPNYQQSRATQPKEVCAASHLCAVYWCFIVCCMPVIAKTKLACSTSPSLFIPHPKCFLCQH